MIDKPKNVLQLRQSVMLQELVRIEYTRQRMSDAQFAAYATQVLGFKVTLNNVSYARSVNGISASNRESPPAWTDIAEKRRKAEEEAAKEEARQLLEKSRVPAPGPIEILAAQTPEPAPECERPPSRDEGLVQARLQWMADTLTTLREIAKSVKVIHIELLEMRDKE